MQMSEEERVLVAMTDPNDIQLRHYSYSRHGNFGLPQGSPGARPWPGGEYYPGLFQSRVVMMPPNALGL
jgi:hypothetical protein